MSLSTEKPINLFFVRSLKQIVLTKVVTILWNHNDVKIPLANRMNPLLFDSMFYEISLLRRKIENLTLPTPIKKSLFPLIRPIGMHLSRWIADHSKEYFPGVYVPSEFFWTSYGTIDQKRTAKLLIDDENLRIDTRYKLACIYCCVDDISVLWSRMNNTFFNMCTLFYVQPRMVSDIDREPLVAYWMHEMGSYSSRDTMNQLLILRYNGSIYTNAFQQAVYSFNKPAAQFYLEKLTETERNDLLVVTVKQVIEKYNHRYHGTDIIYFLFSKMSNDQRMSFFKTHTMDILNFFLCWSYYDFFTQLLDQMWIFVTEEHYVQLLKLIASKTRSDVNDFCYSELLVEIWKTTPSYRNYTLNESPEFFKHLFQCCTEAKTLKLVLNELTDVEKHNLIFSQSPKSFSIFRDVLCDKYDLKYFTYNQCEKLELFLRQCLQSKSESIEFEKLGKLSGPSKWEQWNTLFLILFDIKKKILPPANSS